MSQKASNKVEGQLTDQLKETTLDENDMNMTALIRKANSGAKVGKDEKLEKAIASVKAALQDGITSDEEVLQCFQALEDSSGMKELWKSFTKAKDDSDQELCLKEEFSSTLQAFLSKVQSALEGQLAPAIIEAVIQSGFVHTLVKLLEKEVPLEPQLFAMSMLEIMMRKPGEKNVELFLEMGVVPLLLEQLKTGSHPVRLVVPLCLRHLIKANSSVRDEIVSRGGLHHIIQALKKDSKDVDVLPSILICAKELLQMPNLSLEQFNGLTEALKLVWGNMPIFSRKNSEKAAEISKIVFLCLKSIANYGSGGIELLKKSSCFGVLIGGLSSHLPDVQYMAMKMIVQAALLNQENRESLLRLGVLDSFPGLLRNSSDTVIQLVLECLKVFLDGKQSPSQTKAILKMKSEVEAEMLKLSISVHDEYLFRGYSIA